MKIDLHCHTTASDGQFSPIKLIQWAMDKKIKAIAITDHDTLNGLEEAIKFSNGKDIKFIPGIEIGCNEESLELEDIHVVGLFVDYKNRGLQEMTEKLWKFRNEQKKKIVDKLKALGFDISFREVLDEANGGVLGRPHIARVLMKKYPERYKSINEVFSDLLRENKRAFVDQKRFSLKEVIEIIHKSGGIAILAHPGLLKDKAEVVIDKFIDGGGSGIEVDCPYQYSDMYDEEESIELVKKFRKIAEDKKILISGGGDFHFNDKLYGIGDFGISEKEFKDMEMYVKNGKINDKKGL